MPNLVEIKMRRALWIQKRTDHGGEFENEYFEDLWWKCYCTWVLSSKNSIIKWSCRKKKFIPPKIWLNPLKCIYFANLFWAGVVNITCYIANCILPKPSKKKTLYELWNGGKQRISYFKVLGCKWFILNNKDNLVPKLMRALFK